MTQPNQNLSYTEIIKQTLQQWGLDTLAPLLDQLGRSGAGADEINLRIQQSPEYAQRFAGNAERVAKGLGALSPAEYIGLEGQYRQITSQLPPGFYDNKAATDTWIGGDVSPAELSQRVDDANKYVLGNQQFRDAFNQYYGTAHPGAAVAAILDTNVAAPLIHQQVEAAGVGGAARESGLQITSQQLAMRAVQQGVTIDQARQAYQGIAARVSTDQSILGRFGGRTNGPPNAQGIEEQATLLGQAGAQRQLQNAYAAETAQFHGHGGASDTSGAPGANY